MSWYEELVAAEYVRHDSNCARGAECHLRTAEVNATYVPAALMDRLESWESPPSKQSTVAFAIADSFQRSGIPTPPIYVGLPE